MSSPTQFLRDIRKIAKENGITIRMVNSKTIYAEDDPQGCSGYFDSDGKVLGVSTKRTQKSYYGILAHESSHMDQYIQNRYLWDKHEPGYTLFFDWLHNDEDTDMKIISEAVQDIIRVELDCERRAIKKIKKYNLPVDVKWYIQGVNAYLFGYLFFLEHRCWVPQIYEKTELISVCSTKLKTKYEKIPRRLYRMMNKHLPQGIVS